MKQLILASTSPRRKQLLEQIGLNFTVVPSSIDEKLNPRLKPRRQVEVLAEQKARSLTIRFPDHLILAADTEIVLGGEILGKPTSDEAAKLMLERMSGKAHQAITGFTIIDSALNKSVTKSVVTTVYFRKLSKKEINEYVATGEPRGKSGSYGIQGKGAVFVERIEGDYFTVVGLPLQEVTEELKRFGVTIF